ncbi:hypothetical protein [Streptosporangium vulgare]|uniref:hypothetical protein n=1 Tax=Streptosporangium vulgare TaxID=46190 RepID=UPI0031D7B83E
MSGDLVAEARRVHVHGGVTLALGEGPAEAVRALVGLAATTGFPVSFDPIHPPQAVGPSKRPRRCPAHAAADVDDLLLGEDEALAISGTATCADALSALAGSASPGS